MPIRINDKCLSCGEGSMKKLASYPTTNGSRSYIFECANCFKHVTIPGTSSVYDNVEYIRTEAVSRTA